jgi:hypothetical protein
MPLLDHFHPPLHPHHRWESFHSNWATRLADALTERLPPEFLAEEHSHAGPNLEIHIATYEQTGAEAAPPRNGPATQTQPLLNWAPPQASATMPAVFLDTFEVRVFSTVGGLTLVGAIELISPGNKDRAAERCAFATKCASYLHQGVSLIIIDIVTNRRANLHNEIIQQLTHHDGFEMVADAALYAVAYRPVLRKERPEMDLWRATFQVGDPLPLLPLRLTGDLFVPVDFEAAYQEACRRRRLA